MLFKIDCFFKQLLFDAEKTVLYNRLCLQSSSVGKGGGGGGRLGEIRGGGAAGVKLAQSLEVHLLPLYSSK